MKLKNGKITLFIPSIFLILLYHVTFIYFPNWQGYYSFKYFVLLIVGIFLILKIRVFFNKEYYIINIFVLFYLIFILISSFINRDLHVTRNTFLVGGVFFLIIIECYLLFEYFSICGQTKKLILILYYLTLFYVILTDTILLLFPNLHIKHGMYYLIGNKFSVSYLHLQLIVLFAQKIQFDNYVKLNKKIIFILYSLLTFFICYTVECSTGIVALFFLIIGLVFHKELENLLIKPKTIIFTLLFFTTMLFIFSSILDNAFIKYIIVDILHEDITLTGRMTIYAIIGEILKGHYILGYGMGSSFEVMMNFMHAPNTQNGLLECILEQGILSTSLLIIIIYSIFKKANKKKSNVISIYMIYIYVFLSCIEITLDKSFLIWLALVLVTSNDLKKINKRFEKENINGKIID